MMRVDVGIIGGTGVSERLAELGGETVHVPTPAGIARGKVVEVDGCTIFSMKRHSEGHKMPPHLVNYKSAALGLKALGAKACFATAAVGSLREDWPTGTQAVCTDFLDFSGREQTLFDREVVHTDFSFPFGQAARDALIKAAKHGEMCVYVCSNGPRYETPQEILLYRQLGGDVVGMTAATEAVLMREAGIDYACLAIVTNLAAGLSAAPLAHGDVERAMKSAGTEALDVLLEAVRLLVKSE
jgi:5'-methylthioadenosine phosphorylase